MGRRFGPRRVVAAVAALAVMVGILQVAPSVEAEAPTALFVTGNAASLPGGDINPVAELEDLGFVVTVVDDDAVEPSDAASVNLVVISTTISPSKVGSMFRDAVVPVLTWERFLYSEMSMTAAGSARGEISGQRQMNVVAEGHPMAAGFSGLTIVQHSGTNFSYGVPSAGATVIATTASNSIRATIFAYDVDDEMVGLAAPARRVGFYNSFSSSRTWNEAGIALFRAAVTWAADQGAAVNRAPSVDAGGDLTVDVGGSVALGGSASDDGLPAPPGALTIAWSGPAGVTFDDPTDPTTTATFAQAGSHELTLTAFDGELTTVDTKVVTAQDPSEVKRVLFISSRVNPPSVDRPAAERLVARGFEVVYADDNQVSPADTASVDLVMVTSAVSPSALDPAIADLAVPIMIWERRLYDDFGFTAPAGPSGETSGRSIRIVGDGEPPVAGLTGVVNVYTSSDRLSWTRPEGEATILATASNSPNKITMFSYEQGAAMASSPAPDRRLGFFAAYRGPSKLDAQGWQLFDASVDWLTAGAPANQAPVVDLGPDITTVLGGPLAIDPLVIDDGLPDPPASLTAAWTGPVGVVFDPADSSTTEVSFPGPGTYLLRLTVGDGELSEFDEIEVVVEPNPLEAVIATDVTSGPAPLTVRFDATGSTDVGGGIVSYAWDLDDGTTGSGDTVSRAFDIGSYTVTLTVTDTDGLTDTATVTISAQDILPDAVAAADSTELAAPGPVAFDATGSSDPVGISTYLWDFGDGTTATGATASHTYGRLGVFEAVLSVTTTDGRSSQDRLLIRVGQPSDARIDDGLVLLYDFAEDVGSSVVDDRSGVGVPLDLEAADPSAIEWLPGGGLRLNGPTAIVSAGPATKVREALEASDALTVEAWVDPGLVEPPEPGRLLSIAPADSIRNLSVSQGFVGEGGSRIEARLVSEETNEQGYPAAETALGTLDGDLVHVVFTREASGWQRIWLDGQLTDEAHVAGELAGWDPTYPLSIGADADGLRPWLGDFHLMAVYDRALTGDEVCWNLAAGPGRAVPTGDAPPTACASVDVTTGSGPLTVEADGRGSSDREGAIASYAWNFGDGTTATGAEVEHTYGNGDHLLTLTVTDQAGASTTSSIPIVVRPDPDLPPRPAGFDQALGLRASGGLFVNEHFLLAESWLGSPIAWTSQFLDRAGPVLMASNAQSLMTPGAGLPELANRVDLSLAVPLGFGNANARTAAGRAQIALNLQATAAGNYDPRYLTVAQALVDGGHGDAVLRLGHEFSGQWAPWSSRENEADFIAAWRHVHDLFESVSPDFRFDWNSARGSWDEFGPPAYPGDDYVDIISIDIYWRIGAGEASWTQSRWNNQFRDILVSHRDFAIAHGKPLAYPEWGLIGGDEPRFIEAMYTWMAELPASGPGSLTFQAYFNSGSTREELADHPYSKHTYIELFGNAG